MPITLNHSNIGVQYSTGSNYIIETVKSDLYRRNEIYDNIVSDNIQVAPVTPSMYIENGTNNVYAVESYTYSGSANTADFTRVFTKSTTCDILIVGGGGGGGKRHGAGGGAGTLMYHKNIILNGTYNIKVGKGGTGHPSTTTTATSTATDGNFSQFVKSDGTQNYYAVGGGRGTTSGNFYANTNGGQGYLYDANLTLSSGNIFNSVAVAVSNKEYVNTLTSPEGCRGRIGGTQINNYKGGGGGGAGGVGMNHAEETTVNDGYGGLGLAIDITGTSVVYAGGGNGADFNGTVLTQVFDPAYSTIQSRGGGGFGSDTGTAQNGLDGTGGGGGGQGNDTAGNLGGNGGSGIVIIRYLLGTIPANNLLTTEPVCNLYDTSIYNHSGFNENQTSNIFIVSQNTLCDVLVVAGGGSGGNTGGGGGGGGDVLYFENVNFLANTLYNIYVGRGGQGRNRDHSTQGGGFNGNNSSIIGGNINIIAGGGGGGGGLSSSANSGTIANYTNPNTGLSTVSSGGGGGNTKDNVSASGNNVSGNGASNLNDNTAGGGGGGCGDVLSKGTGADAPNKTAGGLAGDGGIGYESSITGILRQFGGGGGGGDRSAPDSDKTGLGTHGGGNGTTTDLIPTNHPTMGPDNGVNGTGGGGGGCGPTYTTTVGGNGGNGIVIIRQKKLEILNNIIRKITFAPFPTTLVYDFTPYTTLETWREYAYSIGAKTQINVFQDNLVWTFPGGAKAAGIYGNGFISLKLHKNYKNLKVNYTAGASFVELYINDVLNQTCPAGQAREFILLNYNENDVLKILEKESNFSRIIIITYSNPKDALYNINFPTKTVVNVNSGADIILEGSYDINIYTNNSCSMLPSSNNPFKLIKPYPLTSNISNISISYQILNPILDPAGTQWTYNTSNTNVYHMGSVGIGTTSPEYQLDVSGSVNAKSYYLNGRQINEPLSELGLSEGMIAQVRHLTYTQMDVKNNTGWDAINDNLTTGFVIAITPKSNLSKILLNIIVHIGLAVSSYSIWWGIKLYRKIGTDGWTEVTGPNGTETGSAAATAGTPVWISNTMYAGDLDYTYKVTNVTGTYLDSPNTTSTVYYTAYWNNKIGDNPSAINTIYLNRAENHGDAYRPAPSSSWTASEIWYR